MKLISWNTNRRRQQAAEQAPSVLARNPDIVALQEVTESSAVTLTGALSAGGLCHIRSTVGGGEAPRRGPRSYGVLIASRYPLAAEDVGFPVPWQEKVISALVTAPAMNVEIHNVHIPPGSSNGWIKVEMLEAVFAGLSSASQRSRILCGDFNTPQLELTSGEIVTWAQRVRTSGQVVLRARLRGGSGPRWDSAERNILSGLQRFGVQDVYRGLHGYDTEAASWVLRRKHTTIGRRFDHVFATHGLLAFRCTYLNAWREAGLSDHAALEAEFATAV